MRRSENNRTAIGKRTNGDAERPMSTNAATVRTAMGRGKRKRIAEGVYEDASGWSATVKIGDGKTAKQREQRFPAGTSLEFIQAWRRETRDRLLDDREQAQTAAPTADTYRADVERYLPTIAHRPSAAADASHLKAWYPRLADLSRRKIRQSHIRDGVAAWLEAGKSARTVRHRVRVIRELWHALDGKHAPTPAMGVDLPRPPAPHPVAVPWSTVTRVAASLAKGKRHKKGYGGDCVLGRARFLVLATTGQRPTQIMRTQPGDIDLKRRLWFVRAAKGGHGIALPLDAEMVRAWKTFMAANAWGPYDTRSFSHLLRRHGWPTGVRPYSLRSTFAIDMILGGADLSDVQAALGHEQIDTTRRHYASIQLVRARRALRLRKRGRLV